MAISSRKNSAKAEAKLQKPKRTKKKLSGAKEVMWFASDPAHPYIIKSYDMDFENPTIFGLNYGGSEWKMQE